MEGALAGIEVARRRKRYVFSSESLIVLTDNRSFMFASLGFAWVFGAIAVAGMISWPNESSATPEGGLILLGALVAIAPSYYALKNVPSAARWMSNKVEIPWNVVDSAELKGRRLNIKTGGRTMVVRISKADLPWVGNLLSKQLKGRFVGRKVLSPRNV